MFGDLTNFGDILTRNARQRGKQTGIVFEEARLTWREVNARANRFVSSLQKHGVKFGDRVAILSKNCHEIVEILFGLAKIGVVSVLINYRLSEREVEYVCNDAGATFLIAGSEYTQTAMNIASRVASLKEVVTLGGNAPSRCLAYERLIAAGSEAEPTPDRKIEPQDLLLFLYTSGTTGFPKGVMYTHHSTLVGMFIHVFAIGSHSTHRVMLPAPLYSAAGIAGIFCAVYVGSHIVIINFEAKHALQTIERERITFTNFVPTTIQMLATREDVTSYDLSSLKVRLYGGAPMPEPVLRKAAAVFRCDFRQTFAASETGCSGTVLEPEDHRLALHDDNYLHLIRSCGRPQCNIGVRIVNGRGAECEVGEVGEIGIYTEGNMVGYWNNPKATAETLRDGWVYTGDLARRDEDGYIYLVDRKNDMIVSGALNVYPSEVERILYEHPAIFECAVIGVPHEVWGEAVKAVVALKENASASEQELIAFCKERLAGFKAPKSIDFLERLPRNLTGKILRRELREPYWRERGRKI